MRHNGHPLIKQAARTRSYCLGLDTSAGCPFVYQQNSFIHSCMSAFFGLLSFVAFVCIFVGLAKPSLFNRLSKKPMTRLRAFGIFGGAFFFTFVLAAASSPAQPTTDSQDDAPQAVETETIQYISEEGSPELDIEKLVVELLGEETNMDEYRVHNIDDLGDVTLIEYNADSNLTSGLTRFGIWSDVIEIVNKLSEDPTKESITINAYIPLVDQYGNEAPGKVMTVNFNKETWSKINWDNFLTDNVPNVADLYWIHPAIND